MRITARALNRATLGRQSLLVRAALDVTEAVRRVTALQAQEPASPYLALWNRIGDFDPADVDAAFADHVVVKSTLMRMTLHAVHADDYRAFREAMDATLRPSLLNRLTAATGLTLDEADEVVADLLTFTEGPRTADEARAWLGKRIDAPPTASAWRLLRGYAPLWHAPTGAPWSFDRRPSTLAARMRPVLADSAVSDGSLRVLVRRYLEGFGPASVPDVAQFALVQRTRARKALQDLAEDLRHLEGPNGEALFDVPGGLLPDEDTPAPPRLMAMWDSTLLAYHDRSRVIPHDYRKIVIRVNGDVLPTLLVDGYVAGVWRAVDGGIEATAFHRLPGDVWDRLAAEARSLAAVLADREPEVYRRYHHWWRKLPGGDTRLLPGD